jgi:ankyrin repeat protein
MRLLMSLLWAAALTLAVTASLVAVRRTGVFPLHRAIPCVDQPLINDLQSAVGSGDVALARQVLDRQPDLVDCTDFDGWTPLHEAARDGQIPVAKLLLSRGADINATNDDGDSPADCAIRAGDKRMADLLRRHGGGS